MARAGDMNPNRSWTVRILNFVKCLPRWLVAWKSVHGKNGKLLAMKDSGTNVTAPFFKNKAEAIVSPNPDAVHTCRRLEDV